MKSYVVGGAVRDKLLGLPLKDRDHVVVGATPEELVREGYRPVGRDFPVFLHPKTQEEYALARTERKSGHGYKGFTVYAAPDVTLEEDLKRRDLTINAMAEAEDGALIDPFNGKKDLRARVLRHVSEAFAEDPVRILRVARFAARFGFEVAAETMTLMKQMVDSGEADHLVPERVWQEFSKGLLEPHPERMFDVMEQCGFLQKLLPGLPIPRERLVSAARGGASLAARFALLVLDTDERQAAELAERLRVPNDVRELAANAVRNRDSINAAQKASAAELLEILKHTDAFRRPARLVELMALARCANPSAEAGTQRIEHALRAAQAVNAGAVAARAASPAEIPRLLDEARTAAIAAAA